MKHHLMLFTCMLGLAGCGSSSGSLSSPVSSIAPESATVVEQPDVEAPRATDDFLHVPGDTQTISIAVLENDTVNGARLVSYDARSEAGGTVSETGDGVLLYTAPPGVDQDRFSYTIESPGGTSQASVSVAKAPTYYVNNTAPAGGDGSKGRPYNTLEAALERAGGQAVRIMVARGDSSSRGMEIPVVQLGRGQSIIGEDAKMPPMLRGRFLLSPFDCQLQNLILIPVDAQPVVQSGNSQAIIAPPLVLKNVTINGSDGEAIHLEGCAQTQIIGALLTSNNLKTGPGALVIRNPLGPVKVSNLQVEDNAVGGVVVQNSSSLPYAGNPTPANVEINGFRPFLLHNPLQLAVEVGPMVFRLSGFNAGQQDAVSGTLFSADVSGTATCEAWLSSLDFRKIGNQTEILDWTYRDQSSGVLRIGGTTTDYRYTLGPSISNDDQPNVLAPPNLNELHFTTRNQAQAALVTQGAHFSGANPIFVDSYDSSLARVRVQKYSWHQFIDGDFESYPQSFPLQLYSHDGTQIFSRITDDKIVITVNSRASAYANYWVPQLIFRSDVDAGQRIERATNLDYDNPRGFHTWYGYYMELGFPDAGVAQTWSGNVNASLDASYYKNYSTADVNSLGIPNP